VVRGDYGRFAAPSSVGNMAAFGQLTSSLFLKEFVSAFFLSMRYFFAPKATLNYPFEKGPTSSSPPRRARSSTTTRSACSRTATAGSRKSPRISSSTHPISSKAPCEMLFQRFFPTSHLIVCADVLPALAMSAIS
jgi:hypothetical protein